jgi:methyl-accepting chemotaxis protein
MVERLLVKMGANQENMYIRMADLKAQIGSLTSRIDVNLEKLGACHREMKARQEKIEAAVHSFRSELLETIIHQVENGLACVNQRTQDLSKELIENIDETQVDLQLVMTSIDTLTRSLKDDITSTKDCHEVIANTRKGLHKELGLMFQVEAQKTKALIEPTRC